MDNSAEFGTVVVNFDPSTRTFTLLDVTYECNIGTISKQDGPGWIISLETSFLDVTQAQFVAEFLTELNRKTTS